MILAFSKKFSALQTKKAGGGGEDGRWVGGVRGSWSKNGANTAPNVHNCNV